MPRVNSTPSDSGGKTTQAALFTLYCPSCGRTLINFAQHPTLDDHTIAYCVCNSRGPVLDYPTQRPPAQYMTPPAAGDTGA